MDDAITDNGRRLTNPQMRSEEPIRSPTIADPPASCEVGGMGWQVGNVPFRVALGGVGLGAPSLRLSRRSAALCEPPLDPAEFPAPPTPWPTDAVGYVVWSQPISRRRPVFSRANHHIVYAPRQYRRFFIDLSGDFASYLGKFSGKTRTMLRRKRRKFEEASGGAIAWEQYRTPEQLPRFFALAGQVSARSYQERLLNLGLPRDPDAIRAAQREAGQDRLRAFLLFLDGQPIAYLYCPVEDAVVRYAHLGFDPAYAARSPGTVLQLLALESLFDERRYALFDFTEGEGQHKEMFSTGSRLCADVYVINRGLRPAAVVTLHRAAEGAGEAVTALLARLGLKARLRKLVRGRGLR